MSLRFVDGFDHYATADVTKKWSSLTNSGSCTLDIVAGAGRRGTQSFRKVGSGTSNAFRGISLSLDAQATWIIGVAVRFTAFFSTAREILIVSDGASVQCDLRVNPTGTLSVTRAGTALTDGTSTATLSMDTWHYLEWKVTIANSIAAGSCQVRLDESVILTVATGQDTQATTNASATTIQLGGGIVVGVTEYYDDVYVCDGAGSAPHNNFLGDCRIDTILPNGDGTSQQWTPSTAGTHYTLVDEAAPNTTDYVSSNTVGHRDTYGMQDLSALTGTIYGVQLNLAAMKNDAGSRLIKPLILSGGSEVLGAATALSTSQTYALHMQTTDPATGVAWTESAINSLQCGAEVA